MSIMSVEQAVTASSSSIELPGGLTLQLGSWEQLAAPAKRVRFAVFVEEQAVPIEMELDDFDAVSTHAVVFNQESEPLATGRLLPDGHIGRMAVMASARGLGLGAQVLQALIAQAKAKQFPEVVLSAQLHAMGFYQRFGFIAEGEVYLDCDIEHKDMRLIF